MILRANTARNLAPESVAHFRELAPYIVRHNTCGLLYAENYIGNLYLHIMSTALISKTLLQHTQYTCCDWKEVQARQSWGHIYHLLSGRLLIYLLQSHIYLACHMIQYMLISFTPQKLCTEDRGHSGLWKSAQSLCGSDAIFKELYVLSVDRTHFFLSHLRWF